MTAKEKHNILAALDKECQVKTIALDTAKTDYIMFMLECFFAKKFKRSKPLMDAQKAYREYIVRKQSEIDGIVDKFKIVEAEDEE